MLINNLILVWHIPAWTLTENYWESCTELCRIRHVLESRGWSWSGILECGELRMERGQGAIQRETHLSNGHPVFLDSSGMESVLRNVFVTVSVPHAPSVSEFTPAQGIPRLQTIPVPNIQLHSRMGFTQVILWNFSDKPREDKCRDLNVRMVTLSLTQWDGVYPWGT